MEPAPSLCGVTVNHNTSQFVELMLRTLFLTQDMRLLPVDLVVLDNQSDDPYRDALADYLGAQQIPFVQTGFDTAIAGGEAWGRVCSFYS